MKNRPFRLSIPYVAALAGVAGYFFHSALMDGGRVTLLALFCIFLCLLFALAAAALEKQSAFAEVFAASKTEALFSLAGAVLLGAGCVMGFSGTMFQKILALLGLLGAAGWAAAAVLRARGRKPQPFWMVFAVLFFVAKLFYDFRHWMVDPAILDYAFSLFALICFMIACYQAAAFCCDHGSRRQLEFFALAGILFGATAMAGMGTAEALIYSGGELWMLGCAVQAGGQRS